MPVNAPKGTALAKLQGRIFYNDGADHTFSYFMTDNNLTLGRSDPGQYPKNPLAPAQHGVHVGLGDSNKLSRTHARIQHEVKSRSFVLHCIGKNGLTATLPATEETVVMTPDTPPVKLQSRTLIQMGESIFCFVLPAEYPPLPKKKRDWIKAETAALRALMMRLGYGRWDEIIRLAPGRLAERTTEEIIPVARRFVASCYVHTRAGVEQKVLGEILREDFPHGTSPETIESEVTSLIEDAKDACEPNEKRKYVRWARKLRLLRRLRDIHNHSSIDRLREGKLNVFTPKPCPQWTDDDDVDLLLGTYKHGYGFVELIRADTDFGFHDRYLPLPSNKKNKNTPKAKTTPSANGEEEEDEHDADDDDDHDDEEELVNGENGKKGKKESSISHDGSMNESMHEESDSVPSAKDEEVVVKPEPMAVDAKIEEDAGKKTDKTETAKDIDVKMESVEVANGAEIDQVKVQKEKVVFPPSEALMKRLKSVINTCGKEYDRDVRAVRKQTQAQNRAQKRKDDLEQRRKEKAAEKIRIREERKIKKSQPFSKKDAFEFEKALSNIGLEFKEDGQTPDWVAFHARVPQFRNKYPETLDTAFAELKDEANRKVDLAVANSDEDFDRVKELEKLTPSTLFGQITRDRADRVLERLRFFNELRNEVLKNPELSDVLRGCKRSRELPLWWRSTHDKALLVGVEKHGFNAWESVAKDETLPFHSSIQQHEEKYADDPKTLKKGAFLKPSAASKRAKTLVEFYLYKKKEIKKEDVIREKQNSGDEEKGDSEQSGSDTPEKVVEPESNGIEKMEDVVAPQQQPPQEPEPQQHERQQEQKRHEQQHYQQQQQSHQQQQQQVDQRATPLDLVDPNGHLLLPAVVGDGLYLLELGEILPREAFHTNKVLYPVGYRAVRQVNAEAFLCEIRRSHDGNYPMFRVSRLHGFQTYDESKPMWESSDVLSEDPDVQKAWMATSGNMYRPEDGNERYGLMEPTIVHYVQQLPGARACTGYAFRDFAAAVANIAAPQQHQQQSRQHQQPQPGGILEAMKRGAGEVGLAGEMDIPGEWTENYSSRKKRKKNEELM